MATDMEALGRRAVACDGWEPLAGMVGFIDGKQVVVLRVVDGAPVYVDCWDDVAPFESASTFLPLMTEPSTLGCLQELVEEALGFPVCVYQPRIARGMWLVESAHDNGASLATDTPAPTRAEALLGVLEAAQ